MDFENLDDNELVEALRELAKEWQRRFGRRLVVISELAEIYSCQQLDLMRMPSGNRGFDAVDKEGKRYQIKGTAPDQGDVVNPVVTVGQFVNFDFDYALLVMLGSDLSLREIWRAKAENLKVELAKVKNERAGIRVATFQKIGERIGSYKSHEGEQGYLFSTLSQARLNR